MEQPGPVHGLAIFKNLEKFKILACGGDGTVCWVMSVIEEMRARYTNNSFMRPKCWSPPIAVLPLGTGNDLARVLGMGGGYEGTPLVPILKRILNSQPKKLDRWTIQFESSKKLKPIKRLQTITTDHKRHTHANNLGNNSSITQQTYKDKRYSLNNNNSSEKVDDESSLSMNHNLVKNNLNRPDNSAENLQKKTQSNDDAITNRKFQQISIRSNSAANLTPQDDDTTNIQQDNFSRDKSNNCPDTQRHSFQNKPQQSFNSQNSSTLDPNNTFKGRGLFT